MTKNIGYRALWMARLHYRYRHLSFLALDILLTLLIVASLAFYCLSIIPSSLQKIRRIQLSTDPFIAVRTKVMEHHALTGEWLNDDEVGEARSQHAKLKNIQQGAIHAYWPDDADTKDTRQIMSYRPAVLKNPDAASVLWFCGYHPIPDYLQAFGSNETTVPRNESLWPCR